MTTTLYITTKEIKNPEGDGRHDRAVWRSALDKSTIPAGFVFAVDDDGAIEDRSRPFHTIPASKAGLLRKTLLNASQEATGAVAAPEPVRETVEDVVKDAGLEQVASAMQRLGLSPEEFRKLLNPQKPQPAASARPEAVARVR